MSETPKRRWLRFAFSLRTLFVVLTLTSIVVAWLTWNVRRKHQRDAMIGRAGVMAQYPGNPDGSGLTYWQYWRYSTNLPLGLRLVGARLLVGITLTDRWGDNWTDDDRRRYQAAFPELVVTLEKNRYTR